MCREYTDDLMNRLDGIINEFKQLNEDADKNISALDAKINDLYHIIEYLPLNAVELSKVMKVLRESLNARREWKDCRANATSSLSKLSSSDLSHYKSRTKITDERNEKYYKESLVSYNIHIKGIDS